MAEANQKKRIAIGLASGLGNCVYMLPAIKALYSMGHDLALYVDTDFPTADLWRRCIYSSKVYENSADVDGREAIAGEYPPVSWRNVRLTLRFPLQSTLACVFKSNFRLARAYGFEGEIPDVSDWCRALDRRILYDIGIVPGSKGATWLRKRWDRMNLVAEEFIKRGDSVAVFGQPEDEIERIPGEKINSVRKLAELPDLLASCRIIVSTDSGVGHLAASLGIPVVMIYTATSAHKAEPVNFSHEVVYPEGLSCYPCVSSPKWALCRDWKCHGSIDFSKVIRAADKLLAIAQQAR